MKKIGFTARPEWEIRICPFCCQKLDIVEYMKRKTLKVCFCKNCKKTIDERYVV